MCSFMSSVKPVTKFHTTPAQSVPPTLAAAIEADIIKPLEAWLHAHQNAKVGAEGSNLCCVCSV